MPMVDQIKVNFPSMLIADVEDHPSTATQFTRAGHPLWENRTVGFEDGVSIITSYIKQETEGLDIIPIIGMPGLGKSTLASMIFQDEHINFDFPNRIWIDMSRDFNNTRDAIVKILSKFEPGKDTSGLHEEELVHLLHAHMEREGFLLVLDGVRSVEAWRKIKQVLPFRNRGGKVLITSRDAAVGLHSRVRREPHRLRFLNWNESWELLQYLVFGNLEDCPPEFAVRLRNIALLCDGLPLVITLAGGVLADQLMKSPPSAVRGLEEVLQSSRGTERKVEDVMAWSYKTLQPERLRECFDYLGVFPEDYEIPVKMLCRLWISEGFVAPVKGRSLEESAEQNVKDLFRRNLLTAGRRNRMGQVKTCRVHSTVRDFCIKNSKANDLFQVIKMSETGQLNQVPDQVRASPRLCFYSGLSDFLSQSPKGPRTRSFLCFDEQFVEKPEYLSAMLDGYQLLRVLEFKSKKLQQFPSKFIKLIHLRYLTLYIKTLTVLPEALTEVWNLQSLVVETESHSITMKSNLWRMIQLRHFETNAAVVLDTNWEGEAGHNLQTLSRLATESCTEAIFKKAKNLKTLGVYGKVATIFNTNFLEELHHLENLKLLNTLMHGATSERLPQSSCFPPNLKSLTLRNTFLNWEGMPTIAMIKSLEVLKLKDNAFVGESWRADGYEFPSLKVMLIVNADLSVWEASTDAFPSLRYLVVENCEKLKEIPDPVGTHLEKLEIERVPYSVVQSARKIKESKKGKSEEFGFNLKIGPGCDTKWSN